MASFCRSAAAAARSAALRSKSRITSPFPATRSPVAAAPRLRRSAVKMLTGAESLMPLHSAVAGARLRSCIAADSSCWSCLSQGMALLYGFQLALESIVRLVHGLIKRI